MASVSSDECVLMFGSGRPLASKRGRRSYAQLLRQDGPALLTVVVGQSGGRWSSELSGSAHACKHLLSRVKASSKNEPKGCEERDGVVIGLAVIRAWHYVRELASDADTYAMIAASRAFFPQRHGQRFIEHEILASARLHTDTDTTLPSTLAASPSLHLYADSHQIIGQRWLSDQSHKGAWSWPACQCWGHPTLVGQYF